MSARITIVIELDDKAWDWELHGPDVTDGEGWDSKPEAILADALDYASGWRINSNEEFYGRVEFSATLDTNDQKAHLRTPGGPGVDALGGQADDPREP